VTDIREIREDMPDEWGLCASCGRDAEESDYNPTTRVTTCAWCRGDVEPSTEHLFERAMCAKYSE
jgi:hypothetical protein